MIVDFCVGGAKGWASRSHLLLFMMHKMEMKIKDAIGAAFLRGDDVSCDLVM